MAQKTFFNRLINDGDNLDIVHRLSSCVHDHFILKYENVEGGVDGNVGYYDIRDYLLEILNGSKLLQSLKPQQRTPFINGMTAYCNQSMFES